MLLNGDEIKKRGIIENASTDGYRSSTYDLRVGRIISVYGAEASSFILKPQGTVLVISKERIKLPSNVAGYATVKTRLCQDGVLATNIGIIDPGYAGLVSSYLINFGKGDFSLNVDQPFLRLAFHEFPAWDGGPAATSLADLNYVNERKKEVVAFMSDTFLDLPANIKKITDEVLAEWKKKLLVWVPVVGLSLAILGLTLPLGSRYVEQREAFREKLRGELLSDIQARSLRSIEDRLAKLEEAERRRAEESHSSQRPPAQASKKVK